ncbi:MAG: 50S ribosomal protein L10, partial [Bacteroidales bacterium]|nr:50S ribosomal protein L10 [Bacteroidales bacterium]
MRKEEKAQIIDQVAALLEETPNFYVTDISGLNAEKTSELRRACFGKEIKLLVVKNTLFVKALEKLGRQEAAAPVINIMEG